MRALYPSLGFYLAAALTNAIICLMGILPLYLLGIVLVSRLFISKTNIRNFIKIARAQLCGIRIE